jgi:hypothetical protein
MTEPRKRLTLRIATSPPEEKDAQALALLTQAISEKRCVQWIYNATAMEAAPQVLYLKKDSLYCDAVVTARGGTPPQELKLGAFRLAGLNAIALIGRVLTPWPEIDLADGRYGVIIAVRGDG